MDIEKSYITDVQFLSPNEPLTVAGVERIVKQIESMTADLEDGVSASFGSGISLWSSSMTYQVDDVVLLFKEGETQDKTHDQEFAFLLVSTKKDNTSVPNYDMVDGVPNFDNTGWRLLNPTSYLLQDLSGMKLVVKEVFLDILNEHVKNEHKLIASQDIEQNLLKKDYSNLRTSWNVGDYSLNVVEGNSIRKSSNGIMELSVKYSFFTKANRQVKILGSKYYWSKSPIWD